MTTIRVVVGVREANFPWRRLFKFLPPHSPKINVMMVRDSTSGEGGDGPTKRQRINADSRARLREYFASKDWALNTNLPRGNVFANSEHGKMAADLGLSRYQVRTQLVKYKDAKYDNSQVELLVNIDELEEDLVALASTHC